MNDHSLLGRRSIEDFPTTISPALRVPGNSRAVSEDTDDDESQRSVFLSMVPVIQISSPAYFALMEYLTARSPEAAGILVGPKDHHVVTHFVPDDTGDASPVSFTLGHLRLNELLATFLPAGLDAKGIVHSHPSGCTNLSVGDVLYAERCFNLPKNKSLERLLLPLVVGNRFYPYVIFRDDPRTVHFAQVVLF